MVRSAMRRALVVAAVVAKSAAGALDTWTDQTDEFLDRCVQIDQRFPAELHNASLYYAGPSLWSLPNGQRARHGFDGLGRLHRFRHAAGAASEYICHSARFVGSPGSRGILESCDLTTAGAFMQVEGAAWWARLPMGSLLGANMDNAWVNQLHFGPTGLELMTDTCEVLQANLETLETTKLQWNDSIVTSKLPIPPLSTAHPIVHPESGQAYNILLDPGLASNEVVLFRRDTASPAVRHEVARIEVGRRQLVQHSWALSLDFALILGHPMFVDPSRGLGSHALIDVMVEQPSMQNFTRVFVAPLAPGSPTEEVSVDPFILVHVVNTYREEGGDIVLDFEGRPAAGDSESFYGAFRMEHVHNPGPGSGGEYFRENFEGRGYGLHRLRIPGAGARSAGVAARPRARPLHPKTLVFPQISPLSLGRRHCFVWAPRGESVLGESAVTVLKFSLCSGAGPQVSAEWSLPSHSLVAEASFVPSRAAGSPEDAGWLLAPLQELRPGGSGALAVVDASSMTLVSLVRLRPGDSLNWGAHSTFVAAKKAMASAADAPEEREIADVRDALRRCARMAGAAEL